MKNGIEKTSFILYAQLISSQIKVSAEFEIL